MARDEPDDRGQGRLKLALKQAILWPLLIAYVGFLIGFLAVPEAYEHAHFVFFRYVVFGLACLSVPFVAGRLRRSRLFHVLLLFLGYMVATIFWSEAPLAYESWREGAWQVTRLVALILGFLVATVALRTELGTAFEAGLKITATAVGTFAVFTIFYWYGRHPFPEARLYGLGFISNPTYSACMFGVFALMACGFMLEASRLRLRLAYAALFAVLSGYVVLTQSRAALIALLLSSGVLVLGKGRREAIAGISVLVGVIVVFAAAYPELVTSALTRGSSYRPEIWQAVLSRISEAPWFGLGYLAHRPPITAGSEIFYTAHSAYLAAMRDGGVLGFCLLLALSGFTAWRAFRLGRPARDFTNLAVVLFGISCMAVVGDQLIARLEMEWLLLWFPLGLVLADDVSQNPRGAEVDLRPRSGMQCPRE